MRREHRARGVRDARAQLADEFAELLRDVVADGVRDVDGAGAGVDGGLEDMAQEVEVGAPGVFRRELDIVGELARLLHRGHRALDDLRRLHAQLLAHVNR